jgi:hypothetical protein
MSDLELAEIVLAIGIAQAHIRAARPLPDLKPLDVF